MDSKAQFGSNVRKIRRDRGFSQEELADRARLHRTYVGGVERGERNISLENILAIAEALNSSVEALFADIKPELRPQSEDETHCAQLSASVHRRPARGS